MGRFWYEDAVFYHIYTFSAANAPFYNDYGETANRFDKLAAYAPHIKSLGANSILLSPVLKAKSHGYDVTDYFTIDNRLGTNAEFRVFVRHMHENGLRVVVDSVFNHCGRDFFAFENMRNGDRGYADWFMGVDFNRQSPLGDYFTYDTWSGYYELVKFNLNNGAAREYLLNAARFWIDEFDIDGMRLDSANVIDFGFMRDLRRVTTEKKPDFWLMGEVVAGDYSRWANNDMLHSVTNYILYKGLFSSHNDNNLYELAYSVQHAAPNVGIPLYTFLDNHDQPRIASCVSRPEHLATLYALLFTLPGIPSTYYGSEFGIMGVKDNGSDAPLRPYIDLENPPIVYGWLLPYIRRLADIRSASAALRYGAYRQVSLAYRRPYVFERAYENERVIIGVNIGDTTETIDLSNIHGGGFVDLLGTGRLVAAPTLNPHSVCILRIE